MFDLKRITVRSPSLEDGMAVFRLIKSCPPLDINSSYCNLLQCSHFAGTSVAAVVDDKPNTTPKTLAGFISGYIIPERPDTLFIWQVAVSPQARRLGLASRMLSNLLDRPACNNIRYIETTITPDNTPSLTLFKRLAESLATQLCTSVWMDKEAHFDGQHDSESLIRIGPIDSRV